MSLLVGEHSTDAEVGAHGTVKFLDYLSLFSSGLCCFEPPGRLVLSWGVCKGFVPERWITHLFCFLKRLHYTSLFPKTFQSSLLCSILELGSGL
jgi:hypothetical protein